MSYKCPECGGDWIQKNLGGGRFIFKTPDAEDEDVCAECQDD